MTDWPAVLKAGPVREWPGELTQNRFVSKFKATLSDTLQLLDREVWHLTDTRQQQESLEMLIAIPAGTDAWRIDGRPRANAMPEHPGVIIALDSKFGHLSYPCDTFTTWQSNLRAIALALEALRKVDRYGVTRRGEQYRGFLAIEAAAPAGFSTGVAAARFLMSAAGMIVDPAISPFDLYDTEDLRRILRKAQYKSHPDHGGDAEFFQRVLATEAQLRSEGLL
jgi:hypothetical protein